MESHRLTDRIRSYVRDEYVLPARKLGSARLTVRVQDIRKEMSKEESMRGKSSVICQALQSKKLLSECELVVERIDGPPSKKSPTVVVHYRLASADRSPLQAMPETVEESAEAWAARLGGRLRGLLKEELALQGGGEQFLRWLRSEGENAK